MTLKKLAGSIIIAASVLGAGSAMAQTRGEFYPIMEMMKKMGINADGKVTKKEFMDMMAKAFDERCEKIGAKGIMSEAQFSEFLMYLKAGS